MPNELPFSILLFLLSCCFIHASQIYENYTDFNELLKVFHGTFATRPQEFYGLGFLDDVAAKYLRDAHAVNHSLRVDPTELYTILRYSNEDFHFDIDAFIQFYHDTIYRDAMYSVTSNHLCLNDSNFFKLKYLNYQNLLDLKYQNYNAYLKARVNTCLGYASNEYSFGSRILQHLINNLEYRNNIQFIDPKPLFKRSKMSKALQGSQSLTLETPPNFMHTLSFFEHLLKSRKFTLFYHLLDNKTCFRRNVFAYMLDNVNTDIDRFLYFKRFLQFMTAYELLEGPLLVGKHYLHRLLPSLIRLPEEEPSHPWLFYFYFLTEEHPYILPLIREYYMEFFDTLDSHVEVFSLCKQGDLDVLSVRLTFILQNIMNDFIDACFLKFSKLSCIERFSFGKKTSLNFRCKTLN
jgi:hypothetical protein